MTSGASPPPGRCVLGQRSTQRADIAATFDIYANRDRSNGYGIHTFRADEYFDGERTGGNPLDVGSFLK